MTKEYKGAPGRGERYFFDHRLRDGRSALKRLGVNILFSLEFRDGSRPAGWYAYVDYERPVRNQPILATLRDEQGQEFQVSWDFDNITLRARRMVKVLREKRQIVDVEMVHRPEERTLPKGSLLETMQVQSAKIESLMKLLGMDDLLAEIATFNYILK